MRTSPVGMQSSLVHNPPFHRMVCASASRGSFRRASSGGGKVTGPVSQAERKLFHLDCRARFGELLPDGLGFFLAHALFDRLGRAID
jgi:hypothetical protein